MAVDGLPPALETGARVFLRLPAEADEPEFLALVAASRDLHNGWIHPPDSAQEFRAWLTRSERGKAMSVLVCDATAGAIAGVFNLVEISPRLRTAFLSYYAHAAFARRGLMTEGLGLLLRHAFGPLGLTAVGASIQPGNAASLALVRGAGFHLEKAPPRYLRVAGVWRGHPTWSISAARWRALERS